MLRHRVLLIGIAALVAMTSCASFKPISEIEGIVDVDWKLYEGTNASGAEIPADRVMAGKTYYVSVRYLQDIKGKQSWKNLISYDGITIAASDQAFSLKGATFSVPNDPFYVFNKTPVNVTVAYPAPISKKVTKNIAFVLDPTVPSFQGAVGTSGYDGTTEDKHGKNGERGGDAGNLDLEIARYDTKGTSLES